MPIVLRRRWPGGRRARSDNVGTVIDFLKRALSRLRGIRVSLTAASLAFTTMLALVPLATVTFVVVARFPLFEDGLRVFENWVVTVLLPGTGHGAVRDAVVGFAAQAARLTGVSLLFVAITAAMLVATIEREMNLIFGVRRARPFARRFLIYAMGISLGPVVAGASISATTWLIGQSLSAIPMREALATWVGRPLPWLFATVAFALVYKLVPYTRVRWKLAWYVATFTSYQQVYGALAALPLFMLWLYLCWIIVLVGAAIVSALTPGSRSGAER